MNLFKNKIALILVLGIASSIHAALPSNISELVENSAPAVVNITSRKEVKMQNSMRGFDEFERFFGIPRGRGFPQPQQPETREAVSYGSGFIFKDGRNKNWELQRIFIMFVLCFLNTKNFSFVIGYC